MQIGEHFGYLYKNAARAADPDEVIHLAFIDRSAFALQGPYREQYPRDVNSTGSADVPLIFQRSANAWQTHPKNYYKIESFVTTIGKILFGRPMNYAWRHLVVRASHLAEILSRDPEELKHARENSPEETHKRLSYALSMVHTLVQYALDKKGDFESGKKGILWYNH